jgi:hypothetical protein
MVQIVADQARSSNALKKVYPFAHSSLASTFTDGRKTSSDDTTMQSVFAWLIATFNIQSSPLQQEPDLRTGRMREKTNHKAASEPGHPEREGGNGYPRGSCRDYDFVS